ncbi:hypothetical protein GJU39_21915 [Pedobacter petrophilus]|uniref:Uncharacterized protein n=1 Tax=Pedobacter petrophilus TaxID=1908241 RepID=A0A7K0G4J7_9SPHI|nr:hypothetical protein [Pedobacter petrophilus]MRX78737.1 hypothetical protein [Pedobacter petrophilus]
MNHIYVIQDKDGYAFAATYEESKAIEICKEKGNKTTYRLVPFYTEDETEITIVSNRKLL